MSETGTIVSSEESNKSEKVSLFFIDASMKWPALILLISSVLWLQIGSIFALIAAFKLHSPEFLADIEYLTFGRARSVHLNAMIYGWAFNAAFALGLWIMARLSRCRVQYVSILLSGILSWNIAITIGLIGILKGDITSVEWLEIPSYITPIIALSFVLIAVWVVISFRFRKTKHVYVSQWYILAAMFCFPFLYCVAQFMILLEPSRGVIQSLTNWWYAHNVSGLYLTPIALGVAYYLIPKVLGKAIHSYSLSLLGFWTLILFSSFAGATELIGGPIPVWLITVSIVASVMLIIPVLVTAINFHKTASGSFEELWQSPTLRFVVFGGISYTLASLIASFISFRSVSEITHFTHFGIGHAHHESYAFFTMIMFGGFYYMFPRILKCEWPSATLIRTHFWMCSIGVIVMLLSLYVGGLIQGLELTELKEDGTVAFEFLDVMRNTVPWLKARSLSGMLMAIGHMAFAIHVCWLLFRAIFNAEDEFPEAIKLTK